MQLVVERRAELPRELPLLLGERERSATAHLSILPLTGGPGLKLWAPWATSLVGVWLLFAPLFFWAATAASYANAILIGALVVVFDILAPGMPMAPGMSMTPVPDVPPGWSYNPSSWSQRLALRSAEEVGTMKASVIAVDGMRSVFSVDGSAFRTT